MIRRLLELEPVRLYSIVAAVLLVVRAFVHLSDDQAKAIDGLLVVLILSGGQAARAAVTPNARVRARKRG